ncbi:uncharacterized protein BXZ73DRAFT_87906 [Epithele typhae]|uniref:uncharacterized protein n=1 Tax=Epithele typhae TaxID=378194 RepID=UPI002007BAAB|nr:uncharacterized protein BXZ73DRAFT_87906 [Epithele typhae]KAH9942260.1 hypothetical protein BXZ73DRAFT_87906 [Epithele typhae]
MTEEPSSLPNSRSPTRLLGKGIGFSNIAASPQRDHPPIYVPLPPPQDNGASPPRKWTQMDQDETDEKARQKAMNGLVASWMDRLQLISLITTFFAAMESQLLGTTVPDEPGNDSWPSQLANVVLTGALVVHVFAAILAFLAAFFLIRYKLATAKREERKVESGLESSAITPSSSTGPSRSATGQTDPPIWSANPHLEQVGPFRRGQPPTHLLDHCHSLCMWLSIMGFFFALVGVLCFAWSRLALSGGIFASVCMGICLVTGVAAVFWPISGPHR